MPMSFLGRDGGVKAFLTGLGTLGVERPLVGNALVALVAPLTTLSAASVAAAGAAAGGGGGES